MHGRSEPDRGGSVRALRRVQAESKPSPRPSPGLRAAREHCQIPVGAALSPDLCRESAVAAPVRLLLEHESWFAASSDGSCRPELDHSAALGGI